MSRKFSASRRRGYRQACSCKLLEDNSAVFNSHQDSLSIEISNFYAYFNTEIGVALDEVIIDYEDNYSYFKNNKAWFRDYVNFIKNDELLKQRDGSNLVIKLENADKDSLKPLADRLMDKLGKEFDETYLHEEIFQGR